MLPRAVCILGCLWSTEWALPSCRIYRSFSGSLQAVVKLPFADVKRLAVAAQQPDANEQELQSADEVCVFRHLVIFNDTCRAPVACTRLFIAIY